MTMNTVEIRVWMLRRGIKSKDIARALEVTKAAVNRFVAGDMTSNRLRQYFLNNGCPDNLLPAQKPTRGSKA